MTNNFDKFMHLPEMKGKRVVMYLVNENEQIEASYCGTFEQTARKLWHAHSFFGSICLRKYNEGDPVPLDYQNSQYEAEFNLREFFRSKK